MLFNSLAFAVFLPIVFIIYWMIPARFRWVALLGASSYFYLSFGGTSFIYLVLITVISYFCALGMNGKKKKVYLGAALFLSLGSLAFFKYFNFLGSTLSGVLALFTISFTPSVLKIMAPVGISFYTFKIISYMADVYLGKLPVEKHFGKYALYVSFFPQVASGPIERPASFFESLKEEKQFSYDYAAYGLKLMAWGFFKKMIIADKLSGYVIKVFSDVHSFSGFALMAAAFLFSIQIYCDFSGYSDIANGTARLFGYQGAENFKSPYFAASVKEFWGRWHISLSSWFRDYIYIPLGGSRVGNLKYVRNIMVTFLVSGLWHGASWTYVVWGGLHGVVQVAETFVRKGFAAIGGKEYKPKAQSEKSIVKWIHILFVFLFATFAWIFFEAATLGDAFYVIGHMFAGIGTPVGYLKEGLSILGINSSMFLHLALIIFMLVVFDFLSLKEDVLLRLGRLPVVIRWCIYVVFIDLMIIWFLQYGADSSSFVYFQF